MAKFLVQLDVTFSGTVEVNADSKTQAEMLAGKVIQVPTDLTTHCFYHLGTDIVDVEKVEE